MLAVMLMEMPDRLVAVQMYKPASLAEMFENSSLILLVSFSVLTVQNTTHVNIQCIIIVILVLTY